MVRKLGRKKLPDNERLGEPIQVRLSKRDIEKLELEAERMGLERSVFVRMIIRQELNRR